MAGHGRVDQDYVLNRSISKEKSTTIFLRNGVSLKGHVRDHDDFTVFMETEKGQILVYKHAITTVFPGKQHRRPKR